MTEGQSPEGRSDGANSGWAILSTLIAGIGMWGGVGWLLDQWLGTWFATPIGLVLGSAAAIYLVVKRYGA